MWISSCLYMLDIHLSTVFLLSARLDGAFKVQTSPLEFFCSSVHSNQGERSGGTGLMWLYYWWERGSKLTGWHTQLGLQLSWQEDSCEATADMLGGVKMDSNFCIYFQIHIKTTALSHGLKWPDIKYKDLLKSASIKLKLRTTTIALLTFHL